MSAVFEAVKVCANCNESKVNRPRGLCWTCYYTDGVREKYHSAAASEGTPTTCKGKPKIPTMARPGSEEKIRVLIDRAANGLELFHPDDRHVDHNLTGLGLELFTMLGDQSKGG